MSLRRRALPCIPTLVWRLGRNEAARPFGCSALALAVAWATPAARAQSAVAEDASAGPPLTWDAPAGCPGREDVLSHVAALARQDDVRWARFEQIRGRVIRDGGRWSLQLGFIGADGSGGQREMQSGRCDELAEAAAVAIVLAHRSDSGVEGDASDAGDGNDTPAASAPTAPDTEPDGSALTATAAAPDAARAPAAPSANGESASLSVGAEALLDPSTLGGVAFGLGAGLELRAGMLSGGLYGAVFPAVETALGAGQAVSLGLWTGGVRGCLRWGRSLDTCAHFELGQLSAEGVGLLQPSRGRDPWVAPGISAAFISSPFDGFGVTTRVSLYHPLVQARYRVDASDVVHQIPGLAFRFALGVAIPLL